MPSRIGSNARDGPYRTHERCPSPSGRNARKDAKPREYQNTLGADRWPCQCDDGIRQPDRNHREGHHGHPLYRALRPNPLVNLTRHGKRCLAAPGHGGNCPYAASQHLPQRSGYRTLGVASKILNPHHRKIDMVYTARLLCAIAGLACSITQAQPTVHTTDFITDAALRFQRV